MQPISRNTVFDAAFVEIGRHTDNFFVTLHAEAIDLVVQWRPGRKSNPAVSRRDQMHRVKTPNQKSQYVALVIMRVPDADMPFATDPDAVTNNAPVERTAIVDADDLGIGDFGFALKRGETRIARRAHKQACAVDAVLVQVAW